MTTTRWWWVRHAPVVGHGGRIYGQDDLDCDCSDTLTFESLARLLPPNSVWVTSHLRRTQQTARSIHAHLPGEAPAAPLVEPDLAEQHFGDWQGLTHDELHTQRPVNSNRALCISLAELHLAADTAFSLHHVGHG